MKLNFKPLATALAASLQLAIYAAVPLAWEVRPGQPAPVMFDRYHGETLAFSATFRGFGELPFGQDADVRLWYQTNGMGSAWWSAPATIRSNILSAVWSPALDPGAERVSLFFGAPSNAYAAAVLRLRHSPGFAPGAMPDPESFRESDPVFAAWLSTYVPPETSLEPATNYTDRALGDFAATGTVARATVYGTPTRWTDATGCVWEVMLNVWVDSTDGNVFKDGTSIFPSEEEGYMRGYLYYDPAAMEYVGGTGGGWLYNGYSTAGTPGDVLAGGPDATSLDNGRVTFGNLTNLVGRVALTNDLPDVSGYTTTSELNGAISTNNPAFVAAVTNCPVVIASGGGGGDGFPAGDWSDYGTLGALLAAIVAAITWLKNNQRYALHTVTLTNGAGTLLDRAGNRVVVSGDTVLTLPALEHAGKVRDFLVKITTSVDNVRITWQGQGSEAPNGADEVSFVTEDGDFPVVGEAGTYLFTFTEVEAHVFAVAMKPLVSAPQGGNA